MALYFVQHGIALSKEQDADRSLSPEGQIAVSGIAKHLKQCGVAPNAIFHSGKARARQTAELFAEQLITASVAELEGMGPNDDVASFAASINDDGQMYIGHLPHIGKLVSYLVTGDEDSAVVKFSNAAVVCVEQDENGYHIKWFISPEMC